MAKRRNTTGKSDTTSANVGDEAQAIDGEPFDEKMKRLVATLRAQQAEGAKMDAAIAANLKELGHGADTREPLHGE